MIGVSGKNSTITKEFLKLIGEEEIVYGAVTDLPLTCEKYFLCAGVLIGKSAETISDDEAWETFKINFVDIVRFCDKVFYNNKNAKICILGSESGNKGSYDTVYAGSKASLHLYIETKKLGYPDQHIVGVAPTIIEDSGMTQRRSDLHKVLERGSLRRLKRWLKAEEVARVANFALNEPSLCNTVIRMTGGNW